jgi:hypothetical protein
LYLQPPGRHLDFAPAETSGSQPHHGGTESSCVDQSHLHRDEMDSPAPVRGLVVALSLAIDDAWWDGGLQHAVIILKGQYRPRCSAYSDRVALEACEECGSPEAKIYLDNVLLCDRCATTPARSSRSTPSTPLSLSASEQPSRRDSTSTRVCALSSSHESVSAVRRVEVCARRRSDQERDRLRGVARFYERSAARIEYRIVRATMPFPARPTSTATAWFLPGT